MRLKHETSGPRCEWPVRDATRPNRISWRFIDLAAPAFHVATENKVALVDENLFPVVLNERFRCICTGRNLDEAGPISAPPGLIEVALATFPSATRWIAWGVFPAYLYAALEKLGVLSGYSTIPLTVLPDSVRYAAGALRDRRSRR